MPASALRPGGSTRAWRTMRAAMAARLEEAGALPCWRCGQPITPAEPWVLGHVIDRALGGTDADGLMPEHRSCSAKSGNETRRKIDTARRAQRMTGAPGELFGQAVSERREVDHDASFSASGLDRTPPTVLENTRDSCEKPQDCDRNGTLTENPLVRADHG